MSKRQVTKVRIEVEMTLPVGRRPLWGVDLVQTALEQRFETSRSLAPKEPIPAALHIRLLSKETTYL